MLNSRGDEMKDYKIDLSGYEGKVREVVSEAIQEKAFELGCWWFGVPEKRAIYKSASFIFTRKDGSLSMSMDSDVSWFNSHSNTLISAADFLALTPEDVKDAPKDPELKPDQLVLAREGHGETWCLCHFSHRWENGRFCVGDTTCRYCIPYEGNEHLLGTTEEPE
jgi:hypothetical protein